MRLEQSSLAARKMLRIVKVARWAGSCQIIEAAIECDCGRPAGADRVAGMKSAEVLNLVTMLPLLVAERPESDVGRPSRLSSEFAPACDQPQAIEELCEGLRRMNATRCCWALPGRGGTSAYLSRSFKAFSTMARNVSAAGLGDS
jgi:hypothetical protein